MSSGDERRSIADRFGGLTSTDDAYGGDEESLGVVRLSSLAGERAGEREGQGEGERARERGRASERERERW